MWVTCYTDASFSRAHGGAWAVWVTSARGRIVRHGKCPPYVTEANAAELAAIYAAVYLACRAWPGEVRGVLVRSDSQTALIHADPLYPLAKSRGLRRCQERLRAVVAEHALELQLTWVKGHQARSSGTAAFLNNACDRLAKAKRRDGTPAPRPARPHKRRRNKRAATSDGG